MRYKTFTIITNLCMTQHKTGGQTWFLPTGLQHHIPTKINSCSLCEPIFFKVVSFISGSMHNCKGFFPLTFLYSDAPQLSIDSMQKMIQEEGILKSLHRLVCDFQMKSFQRVFLQTNLRQYCSLFFNATLYKQHRKDYEGLDKKQEKITILHSYIKDNMYHFAHFIPQTKHFKLEAGILNTEQPHS